MQVAELNIKIQSQVAAAVAGLNQTEKALDKVTTAAPRAAQSLATLSKASNQSQNAMQNLGRVLQDAPYGFIGIQNNLNPLLESFQRLKTESGSTGGALKALGSSLIGGGGVGLALSAVTALVTFATAGFGAWTRGLTDNSKAAKEAADATQQITQELSKEITSIDTIVAALKNEKLSRDQRKEAISELQRISPAYFATLNTEKATIEQITRSYDRYNESIIRTITSRVREKELEKTITRIVELETKRDKITEDYILKSGKVVQIANARVLTLEEEQSGIKNNTLLTNKETEELTKLYNVRKNIADLIAKGQGGEVFNKINSENTKVKTKKIDVESDAVNIDNTRFLTKNKVKITVPVAFDPDIQNMQDAMDVLVNENNKRIADIVARNQEFTNNFRDTVLGLAETFANAFSQKNPLKSFLGGSLTMVGDFLQRLGKAAIAASAVGQALKKILVAPTLGFAAGLAAIAIGGILKSAAPRFARGGGVTGGPQLSLIGDNPSGKEAVVPFERLGEFARAAGTLGGGGGILEARISGFDLLFLLNKTGRANNRQFGI